MLTRLLKNNRIGGLIFVVILMILIWLKSLIAPTLYETEVSMPLYDLIFGRIESDPITSSIAGIILYSILAILVYRLNVIHFLLEERSFMPSAFFIMIVATYPPALQINPFLVGSLFLFLAIITIIKGEEHRAEPLSLFNASLLLAFGGLFYLKLLYFIPFLWITASIIRPIQWRGFVNPILALFLFFLFNITYYWVFKNDLPLFTNILRENFAVHGKFENFSNSVWILQGFLFFMLIISSVRIIRRFQFRKIIVRKLYQVFLFLFIYTLLFYLIFSGYENRVITIIALPLCFLFSITYNQKKSHWSREVLLWMWFGLIGYVIVTY